jgi:hypothetical protein
VKRGEHPNQGAQFDLQGKAMKKRKLEKAIWKCLQSASAVWE